MAVLHNGVKAQSWFLFSLWLMWAMSISRKIYPSFKLANMSYGQFIFMSECSSVCLPRFSSDMNVTAHITQCLAALITSPLVFKKSFLQRSNKAWIPTNPISTTVHLKTPFVNIYFNVFFLLFFCYHCYIQYIYWICYSLALVSLVTLGKVKTEVPCLWAN